MELSGGPRRGDDLVVEPVHGVDGLSSPAEAVQDDALQDVPHEDGAQRITCVHRKASYRTSHTTAEVQFLPAAIGVHNGGLYLTI